MCCQLLMISLKMGDPKPWFQLAAIRQILCNLAIPTPSVTVQFFLSRFLSLFSSLICVLYKQQLLPSHLSEFHEEVNDQPGWPTGCCTGCSRYSLRGLLNSRNPNVTSKGIQTEARVFLIIINLFCTPRLTCNHCPDRVLCFKQLILIFFDHHNSNFTITVDVLANSPTTVCMIGVIAHQLWGTKA